ncbi:MAG: DUF3090 family protein [Actinobacteria bacterium]|nr:DUF3090 family protein [Actinomycetota bacterium]
MSESTVTPVVFTADYLGRPGERTFFIQASGATGVRTFTLEKEQVGVLAERLRELLLAIDSTDTIRTTEPARDPALSLVATDPPEWRVGSMALAYDEASDNVYVVIEEVGAGLEDGGLEDGGLEEGQPADVTSIRFVLRRDQIRAFVLHALAVVAEGRPTCQLCGLPMDPDGHNCPASNGHRPHHRLG